MKPLNRIAAPAKRRFQVLLFAGMAFLLLTSAPSFPAADVYDGDYPYRVGATVGMVADIVREVAGDRAEVTNIIGAGVDPHVYSPTRSDVAVLLRSDIIFYAGLLLEGQMTDILARIGKRRPVIPVTERLKPEDLIHDAATEHNDPHVWMDVQGWMRAVEVVRDALISFDPENAPAYGKRATRYLETLKDLDDYVRRVIASIPENQRVMITAHDAFNYFGQAYNIEVMGIQGLSTESEAGLKDINRLVDILVERRIPAVFVETSVSDKNVPGSPRR